MMPLRGQRILALGGMAARPLGRLLQSLGAEIVSGKPTDSPAGFSFVIDDLGLERLQDHGWDAILVAKTHPALIHASVSTFGSGNERSRWLGSELVASAMGGTLRLTGSPLRRPVKEALDACAFHADMVAAAGLMAAHYERGSSGLGQHVDVSIQEVAFNRNVSGVLGWQFEKRKLQRTGAALNYGKAQVRCIWALSDGWCFHSLMTGKFGAPANQALSDWMDQAGVDNPLRNVDWQTYNRSTLAPEIRAQWEQAIEAFFRTRSKQEILSEGRTRGINACVVAEPSDVLADPHLQAREFWQASDRGMEPRRFVRIEAGSKAAAPRKDGDSVPVLSPRPPTGPLSGLRVLDFSWALVGSITTKTLGDLGAEVIKVESRGRPCLSRLDVQVSASKAGNFDDKPWFAHLNSSKHSLALDMKHPRAFEVLEPLIAWADVVVENFSPGTMAKLGLDFASLNRLHPGIVMISGSVYGQTGPLAQEWGVDGTGGALSGRTFLTGWPDHDPVVPGSVPYGDVIVPFVMAAAGVAALQVQRKSGQGAHIDASMYEICVQQMRQALEQAQTGERPLRQGNAERGTFHQDVYPVAGEDRWIALTLPEHSDWNRLVALAGSEDIGAWTAGQDEGDLMRQLQSAGIAAGVVQDIEDLVERDPVIAVRKALVQLDHPLLGPFGHMRTPIGFSRSSPAPFRAPGLGEHSLDIGHQIAGLEAATVAELQAMGVFR
jgi:crotonobetainyl-CoA:carnitine CoA-transferase CaiB-like acyl-CoA transferase